jgi:PPOX class probable F420-dependent enzyme
MPAKLAGVYSVADPEVRAFLLEGTRTGKLSYRAADGRPLVAPVWFVIEDDRLVFNTGKDTAKGHALARDPRVALCVDLEQPPYAYVQVQGVAELSEDPADLLATATAIAARYMGPGLAEEFGRRNAVPGELVVRLRPSKVIAHFDISGLREGGDDRVEGAGLGLVAGTGHAGRAGGLALGGAVEDLGGCLVEAGRQAGRGH